MLQKFFFYTPKVFYHFKSPRMDAFNILTVGREKLTIESDWGAKSCNSEKLAITVIGSTQSSLSRLSSSLGRLTNPLG